MSRFTLALIGSFTLGLVAGACLLWLVTDPYHSAQWDATDREILRDHPGIQMRRER